MCVRERVCVLREGVCMFGEIWEMWMWVNGVCKRMWVWVWMWMWVRLKVNDVCKRGGGWCRWVWVRVWMWMWTWVRLWVNDVCTREGRVCVRDVCKRVGECGCG